MRAPLFISTVGLMALGSACAARAEDAAAAAEQVVVTATRTATPEDQVGSSISVITADDIAAQQAEALPDVLLDVPGLNLVRTGGPGGTTTVFMRGTNTNHTKVLVDGIDVTDPSNANATFDFSQLLAQDIERVEVLRGPQSGLYGSDAIGGVINVITKSGTGPATVTATAEGGSFATFNQSLALSGADAGWHYSANVEHFHTGSTPVTPLELLAPGEARHNDYYDNLTGSTKLGYDFSQSFDVGLVARYTDSHLRYTGQDYSFYPSIPEEQPSASNTNEAYARIWAHLVSFAGFLDQTLGVAYTHKRTADYDLVDGFSLQTGERSKVDWQGVLHLAGATSLVLGAEHAHDEISQPLSAGNIIDSGYAELQSQLAPNLYSALNVRYDDNNLFGNKVTYRVAPAYLIPDTGTKLKASVGTGFKAPTLSELYQNYPYFFANPNLKPENSVGYDVGLEQTLASAGVRAGVTYYHNHIRDLIETDITGTTYANIGRATTQGIESFAAWEPVKSLTLRADYTYTEANDDILHEELLRRPKHKASLSAAWRATQAFSLTASVLTVSSWIDGNRDFSIPRLTAPGYTLVNVAGSYAITARIAVFARIDNLLDRHYQNPVGYLQPSTGAYAGLKLKL